MGNKWEFLPSAVQLITPSSEFNCFHFLEKGNVYQDGVRKQRRPQMVG